MASPQARLDEAAAEIERVAPGTTRRPTLPPSPPVEQVGAVLAADTVLVEFVLGDRELLVFTVTATACHGRRAEVDVRALLATIGRLHARWSIGRPDGRLAAELAEVLLRPVHALLVDHSRVVIVPHRTRHLLTLHVLPFEGRPLGAEHTVSQLPAAALLPHLAGQPGPRIGRGSLVVGDPATDPARGMRRLPGARVEAITVARVWARRRCSRRTPTKSRCSRVFPLPAACCTSQPTACSTRPRT